MGLKGKKLNSDVVMFGEPLSEKALKALQKGSPTADQIIKSLPPSSFLPIQGPTQQMRKEDAKELKKEEERNKVIDAEKARKDRLKKKREAAIEKRKARLKRKQEIEKETIVETIEPKETIVENLIKENLNTEELPNMNLDEELKSLEKDIKSKKIEEKIEEIMPAQEEPMQADLKDQILELLEGEENAPGIELINAWKEAYGKNGIHVMAFGEGDVYVYHHLTRGEWKKIKELMSKMRNSENAEEVEEKLKEKVVLYCVLWPGVDEKWLEYCKAGILDSLYQMILLNSGFLTPQQAMLLTTQL